MHKTLGAIVTGNNSTLFRVWAPACESLELEIELADEKQRLPMTPDPQGFFHREVAEVGAGTRYRYRLPSGEGHPDPASRFQPQGVHGWSQVVDPYLYSWRDQDWRGVARQSLVIYEMHVGTFTHAGTYLAAIHRLDELVELGINAVELMPIAESAGRWNWGYDGVNFFAPRHTYGSPDEFRRFVDAAHQRGLAVILDVVYNHFGPEGNYLREFGAYVSDKRTTAWGEAPNFDGADPEESRIVRDFFIANVSYWIEEYHLDGLRIDAIHCMSDDSQKHIATELAEAMDRMRSRFGRELHLIAESNVYDPDLIATDDSGGHGYDAEWCDDFLHSVFAVLRPGEHMSQRTYDADDLQATLQRGFVYQGGLGQTRRRIPLSAATSRVSIEQLVFSIQNHDFIGNHPLGQRLHQLTSDDAHRAAAALLILFPAIPMLFMGEEFASNDPFYFFVDYGDEQLRHAVEIGRRAEYPQHDWSGGASPLSASAFEASKLGPAHEGNARTRNWYRELIALRKQWKSLGLMNSAHMQAHWQTDARIAELRYEKGSEHCYVLTRLDRESDALPPLLVQVEGTVQLSQNCEALTPEGRYQIGPRGVIVGQGQLEILECPQP